MAISTPGIGSGLDVNSIVTGLMSIEKQPLTAIAKQKTDYQSQVSAYGALKSALSTFQTAVKALSSADKFNAQTITSGDSKVLTATSNGSATLGDYAVTVSQLAKSQKLSLAGFASTADVVGAGTLTISFGTFTPEVIAPPTPSAFTPNVAKTDIVIAINSGNNTLAGVRDAINATQSSVSASIVNDGTTNRLVITSKDTGEVNTLKISVADDDATNTDTAGLSQLAYDPTAVAGSGKNLAQMQEAKNAILDIDGIAIVKASNTITDVIEGVTLNLLATSNSTSVALNVATNQEAIKTSVSAFVDAYNKLNTTLRGLVQYDPTGKNSGVLLGDATARTVISQIKSVMTKPLGNLATINSLSQIGVGFQRDGTLALDSTKLAAAVSSNFNDIAALFAPSAKATDPLVSFVSSTSKTQAGTYALTVSQLGTSSVNAIGTINGVAATGSGTSLTGAFGDASAGLKVKVNGGALGARGTVNFTIGYAAQLDNMITGLLNDDGVLKARTDGMQSSITRLDKQTDALNVRLTAVEARYRAQYTRLDTLLSNMSKTSSFLTQQIAAFNANNN